MRVFGYGEGGAAVRGGGGGARGGGGGGGVCAFTQQLKLEIFSALRAKADERKIGVPQCRTLREDLHSISRVVTANGNVTYRAPHNADGHADRCNALALCVRAGSLGTGRMM